MRRARLAARIAALKVAWTVLSLGLFLSVLVEYTQPHPSPYTFVFVLVWIGYSIWTFRTIRRARGDADGA